VKEHDTVKHDPVDTVNDRRPCISEAIRRSKESLFGDVKKTKKIRAYDAATMFTAQIHVSHENVAVMGKIVRKGRD